MFMYPFGSYSRPPVQAHSGSLDAEIGHEDDHLSPFDEDYDEHGAPLVSAYTWPPSHVASWLCIAVLVIIAVLAYLT